MKRLIIFLVVFGLTAGLFGLAGRLSKVEAWCGCVNQGCWYDAPECQATYGVWGMYCPGSPGNGCCQVNPENYAPAGNTWCCAREQCFPDNLPTATPVPPTNTPVPQPTNTPIPPTPTLIPTLTPTPVPTPTMTPIPTNTPTLTPTPRPTSTPTPTPLPPTPTPTLIPVVGANNPAEQFIFDPSIFINLNTVLGERRYTWYEVAE